MTTPKEQENALILAGDFIAALAGYPPPTWMPNLDAIPAGVKQIAAVIIRHYPTETRIKRLVAPPPLEPKPTS